MSSDDQEILIEWSIVKEELNSPVVTPQQATRPEKYVGEVLIKKDRNEKGSSQTNPVLKEDKVATGRFKDIPETRPTIERDTVEQEVIVLEDDDDEIVVNNNSKNEINNNNNNIYTSFGTPSSSYQIPHTMPMIRIKPEPGCPIGRTSEGMTNNAPNAENPYRQNSISFVKAVDDPVSVEIISANFIELSNICTANRYTLVIDSFDGVEVRITPFTDHLGSPREAFRQMEEAIERKKKERDDLASKLDVVSKELTECKKKIEELACKKEESSDAKDNKPPAARRTYTKRKRHHGEIENLQHDPKFLKDLHNKLAHNVKRNPENPFFNRITFPERRAIILDYFDFLRYGMDKVCTETNIKMCKQFGNNWKLFVFQPSSYLLNKRMDDFKEKFNLPDPIVGSVHFVKFNSDDNQTYYLCMAICDNRIVAWRSQPTKQEALRRVRRTLYACGWNTDFKFAVNLEFPSRMDDYYVECHDKDLFQEDGKPVKWLKDNFPSLETNIYGYHDEALPAIYNTAAPFM